MASGLSKRLLQASIVSLISAAGLAACGGGSSGGSTSAASPPPPPPPPVAAGTSFKLDGSTTKGLILEGYVDVSDAADAANILVSGRTDNVDGTYDLDIPATANFTGPFVRVTVEGGPGAVMVCDAGDGCLTSGGTSVAFGDTFAIDDTVTLSAIVPTPAQNTTDTVNLTIFSDLAASLADSNAGALTAADIDAANAQVSDLFGLLTVDLTELESVNVADSATSSTDDSALRAAILSGGVLGAALENGADIGTALDNLRADFVANDGQLVINEDVDDPALISLEDILSEALTVAQESEISGEDFQQATAEILGDSVSAGAQTPGEETTAGTAPSNSAPALDQAKAFVSDLQLIVEAVSQDNEDNLVDFAERVEAAALLIDDEAESAIDAALRASEAIALAYEAYQDDNSITTFSANGFNVDVSSANGDLSLVIASQTVGAETVEMSILGDLDVEFTEVDERDDSGGQQGNIFTDESSGERSTVVTIGNDASFSGRVENTAVLVEILGGDVSVLGGDYETTSIFESVFIDDVNTGQFDGTSESTEFVLVAAERVVGNLEVNITEKRSNGLAFTGSASASLVGGRFESEAVSENEQNNIASNGLFFDENTAQFESTDVSFSGTFSEGGQFVDVSLAFQADGNDLVLTDGGEREDVLSYSVANNILTITTSLGDDTFEFVTHSEARAELDSGAVGPLGVVGNGFELYGPNPSTLTAVASIPDVSAPVLRLETQLFRQGTGFTNTVFFFQTDTIQAVFFSSGQSDDFFLNPPTDIVEYYNEGIVIENRPGAVCLPSPSDTSATLYILPEPFLTPAGSSIEGIETEEFFNSNGSAATSRCQLANNAIGFSSFAESNNTLSFDPDAAATGLVAASVSQNIAGIDPTDSEVTASFFGPLSFANEEVGGNLTFKLDFAGRTFQTDARSLAIFDNLTSPVTVTNQDEVMMVISEDANGEATGQVTLDGTVHGTITEDNGVVIVTYTDNTFVSIQ